MASARQSNNHVDRLPPSATEAEMAIIGSMITWPSEAVAQCVEAFPEGSQVIYDIRHIVLYETCLEMWSKGETIDIITVSQKLKDDDALESVGGLPYISTLIDAVWSIENLQGYIAIVREKFTLRSILRITVDAGRRVYEGGVDTNTLLEDTERAFLDLSKQRDATGYTPIKTLVKESIESMDAMFSRNGGLTGIATGFPDCDRMTSGLQNAEMIVIAGRPGTGKTSLAMNIAEFVVLETKLPVGVFSLEMSSRSLVMRMIASRSRVNLRSIQQGFMSERDFPKLTSAAGRMSNAPLYIDDTAGLTIMQLRAKARRMQSQWGIKLFIIDYLQLMRSGSRRENRQQEVSDIAESIKGLSKELNVPIVALSQLNRGVEKDKGRPPQLSDLRESGSIEQTADLVGLLYRPTRRSRDDDDNTPDDQSAVAVTLNIAKQRNGPTGDVNLTFLKPYTRFESAAKVSDDDVPMSEQREFNHASNDP